MMGPFERALREAARARRRRLLIDYENYRNGRRIEPEAREPPPPPDPDPPPLPDTPPSPGAAEADPVQSAAAVAFLWPLIRQPHWRIVQNMVAEAFGIARFDMLKAGRQHRVVRPRQVAMLMMHELLCFTWMRIARIFCCDHTTVMSAVAITRRRMQEDAEFGSRVDKLRKVIRKRLSDDREREGSDGLTNVCGNSDGATHQRGVDHGPENPPLPLAAGHQG